MNYIGMFKDRMTVILPSGLGPMKLVGYEEDNGAFEVRLQKDPSGNRGSPDFSGGVRYEFLSKTWGIRTKTRFGRTKAFAKKVDESGNLIRVQSAEPLKSYTPRLRKAQRIRQRKAAPANIPVTPTPLVAPVSNDLPLRECIRRVNQIKSELKEDLVLSVNDKGELEAMVRYS